jgi:hypothetical protein
MGLARFEDDLGELTVTPIELAVRVGRVLETRVMAHDRRWVCPTAAISSRRTTL